jgi:hypothetical protein
MVVVLVLITIGYVGLEKNAVVWMVLDRNGCMFTVSYQALCSISRRMNKVHIDDDFNNRTA